MMCDLYCYTLLYLTKFSSALPHAGHRSCGSPLQTEEMAPLPLPLSLYLLFYFFFFSINVFGSLAVPLFTCRCVLFGDVICCCCLLLFLVLLYLIVKKVKLNLQTAAKWDTIIGRGTTSMMPGLWVPGYLLWIHWPHLVVSHTPVDVWSFVQCLPMVDMHTHKALWLFVTYFNEMHQIRGLKWQSLGNIVLFGVCSQLRHKDHIDWYQKN